MLHGGASNMGLYAAAAVTGPASLSRAFSASPAVATGPVLTFGHGPVRQPHRKASSLIFCRAAEGINGEELLVGEFGTRLIVPSYDEDEDSGEVKLECDDSGCVTVMPRTKALSEDPAEGFLRCDLTGCYFSNEPQAENSFEVLKGQGWCLGYETAPESEESFSAVIGAGGWSIALTASEFSDFSHLVQTLRKGISALDEDGYIGKDDITMQAERGTLWMACSIPKKKLAILQSLWKVGFVSWSCIEQILSLEIRGFLTVRPLHLNFGLCFLVMEDGRLRGVGLPRQSWKC